MLAVGSVLSIVGLGFFCWLLFTVAIYALPTFAGLTVGLAAFHSGAGVIGALVVGLLAGSATLALGQLAIASTCTPLVRFIFGLVYALPAAIAGYHVVFALARIGTPGSIWQTAFAVIGAVVSGCTAFSRLAIFSRRRTDSALWSLTRLMTGGCTTRVIDARRVPTVEQVGDDGCVEARIVELERSQSQPSMNASMICPLAQSTRGDRDALSTIGWAETMPSYFYATAAISAPGTPDLLRGTPQVGHDFS